MAADRNVLILMQQQQQQQQNSTKHRFMAMDQAAGGWNYLFTDAGHRHYSSSSSSSINTASQLAELERSLFSSEAADIDTLADTDVFAGDGILGFLEPPLPKPPRTDDKPALVVGAGEAPFQSSSFQSSVVRKQVGGGGGGIPQPPRLRRSVAEELKSLSLDQFVSSAHKRASSSPLASPKKQAHKAEASSSLLPDSKEGLQPPTVSPQAAAKRTTSLLQRSLSSHALGQLPPSSALDSAMQGLASVPSLSQLLLGHGQSTNSSSSSNQVKPSTSSSSDAGLSSMRRVCSTGDIQRMNPESQDELGFKIGKYNLAERKERIHRYRQKRSERNFNKKIKYACRKTLADSRPRVRGRFARNEDVVSTRPTMFPDDEVEALCLEEEEAGFLIDRQSSGELWDLS